MKFFTRKKQVPHPDADNSLPIVTIDMFISEHVKPLLKQAGFAKYGRTFYRTRSDIINVINFQGSQGNGFGNQKFYINYGIDSSTFQIETTGKQDPRPKVFESVYHDRIRTSAEGKEQFILEVSHKVANLDAFAAEIRGGLQKLLDFYTTIQSTDDLIDLCIAKNGLQSHEELCYYLTKHQDRQRLEQYIQTLYDMLGNGKDKLDSDERSRRLHKQLGTRDQPQPTVDRWSMFADRIYSVIGKYQKDPAIKKLLAGHAPPNHPQIRFKPPVNL